MGGFIYTLLGTSKDVTLGPTAIMSLLCFSMVGGQPHRAVLLSLLCGLIQAVMALLRLGEGRAAEVMWKPCDTSFGGFRNLVDTRELGRWPFSKIEICFNSQCDALFSQWYLGLHLPLWSLGWDLNIKKELLRRERAPCTNLNLQTFRKRTAGTVKKQEISLWVQESHFLPPHLWLPLLNRTQFLWNLNHAFVLASRSVSWLCKSIIAFLVFCRFPAGLHLFPCNKRLHLCCRDNHWLWPGEGEG